MKLFRHGKAGHERPGMIDASGQMRDLDGVVSDIAGEVLLPEGLARLALRTLRRAGGKIHLRRS